MFPLCSILWIRLTRQYITELPHRESTFILRPRYSQAHST
jgi:hypothetical protein